MSSLLALLALGQVVTVQQGRSRDGGLTWPVECVNCGGGVGGGLTDAQLRASPVPTADTHTTAAAPLACRLSDGAAFYTAGGGGAGATFGAAFPATGSASGAKVLSATPSYTNGNLEGLVLTTAGRLVVDGSQVTQPVSGTMTCNAGTGTFAVSGTVTDNQGTAAATAGAWPVKVTDGTNVEAVKAASTAAAATDPSAVVQLSPNQPNLTTPLNTSARVVGNAGGIFDAANNATAPANEVIQGDELQSGASAALGTAGQVGRVVASLDHVQYARLGGPVVWSCLVQGVTATTQCQAAPAAGLRAYVTSMACSNQAASVQGVDVVFGTGAACATGITALTHKFQMGTLATTSSPNEQLATFITPLVPTAANAICVRPTAATAFGCTLTGFTAP